MSDDSNPEEISADDAVDVTFKDLGLGPQIIKALDDLGYERPTPIQARAIPAALEQRDVLGIAQTGTGKTGAFTLPTMHKLARGRARARMPRCLIICPTRELAAQVAADVETYGKYLKLEMALLIGGVSFAEQDRKLMKGVDILIATPGRLLDQFERGKILMTGVQTLIVDEADRMLDMGFIPDIERIFEMTPFTRQVLFFSATMPNEIKRLVDQFLHRPVKIQVARQNRTAKTVTQRIVRMPSSDVKQKRTALRWLIERETVDNGIIFCNRKRDVDIVAKSLNVHGHDAAPIHGDLTQQLRTQTLDRFRNGEIKYLVASDVAARGLDVASVSHVFNFDVPSHSEDYVHRIGRTGRAGRKGDAIMLVAKLDERNYQDILDLIKVDAIEEIEIPGIEDFPKEGKQRRGGRDGGKGRGRSDRGRKDSRNHGQRKDGSYHDGNAPIEKVAKSAPKSRSQSESKSETEEMPKVEKPARKPAPRRRAAPGRTRPAESKTSETPSSNTKKTENRSKPAPERQAKREPKREPQHRTDRAPKRESRDRSDEKPKRENRSRNSNEKPNRSSASDKPNRKRGRGSEIGKADAPGFGEEIPAFFRQD